MENKATFSANLEDMVQSLEDNNGEATAALAQNPSVNYIKFTLTDDKPNGNKQRVPQEEFSNLIRSGLFMPIKKAIGKTEKGHKDSYALGVISHLKQTEDKIKGIATLWTKERPKDVEQIKEELKAGKNVNISWELTYDTEASEEVDGVTTLKNVFLTAATIVGLPAYKGRTSIEAFASEDTSGKEEEMAEDKEEKDLAKLTAKFETIQEELRVAKQAVLDRDTELVGLKGYKEEVEKVEKDRKKLGSIKQKFTTAKINKDENYFEENKEKLLALDENTLEYLLQDLKVFAVPEVIEPDKDKSKIPPIVGTQITPEFTPKSIGEALRESFKTTGK